MTAHLDLALALSRLNGLVAMEMKHLYGPAVFRELILIPLLGAVLA